MRPERFTWQAGVTGRKGEKVHMASRGHREERREGGMDGGWGDRDGGRRKKALPPVKENTQAKPAAFAQTAEANRA